MFRVLLPVDGNEDRALAAAETVAQLPSAAETVQVTILNVERKLEVPTEDGSHVSSTEWYDDADFPTSALAARDRLEDVGLVVEMRREHGDPGTAILEVAEEIGADRIVMAGQKRSPVGKVLFGSVTQSVLLDSDVPVTVLAEEFED